MAARVGQSSSLWPHPSAFQVGREVAHVLLQQLLEEQPRSRS